MHIGTSRNQLACQKKSANSRIRFPLEGTHKNMTVGSEMPSQNSITISSWSARNQWPVWWISKCKPCSIVLTTDYGRPIKTFSIDIQNFWAWVVRVVLTKLKFMFSEKATNLMKSSPAIWYHIRTDCPFLNGTGFEPVFRRRQIDGEYFVNFCGLLRKHEL